MVYVDDPDVDGAVGTSPEALIQPRIETAIAKLRISVPRAQAQVVATNTCAAPREQGNEGSRGPSSDRWLGGDVGGASSPVMIRGRVITGWPIADEGFTHLKDQVGAAPNIRR